MMPNLDAMFKYFAQYNLAVWPMQIVGYVLGATVLLAAVKRFKYSDQVIAAILAFWWLWLGVRFWLPGDAVFQSVYVIAALSLIQGVLFLVSVVRPVVSYRVGTDAYSLTGLGLIVFAMIFYPLIGFFQGHIYPQSLTLGVFPCPTTIFTLGLFLCTASRVPKYMVVVPVLGAIMLGSISLYGVLSPSGGIFEDIALLISGVVAIAMLTYRDRAMAPTSALRPAA